MKSIKDLMSHVDHTVLAPTSPLSAFEDACAFARENGCASVCISPFFVKRCAELLKGSGVKVCTVVGFPHGLHATRMKAEEAGMAINDGADEVDMVVNAPMIKAGDWDYTREDVAAVTRAAHGAGKKIKVIFENCNLTDDEKAKLSLLCTELKCDWVKTSTGFGTGGATMEDLRIMKANIGPEVQMKAAGGIRTLAQMEAVIALGCTRVGCSRTAAVLDEARAAGYC